MAMRAAVLLITIASLVSCQRAPEPKRYEVIGQIVAVAPERNEVTIKHEDIKNFMPAMTMPYKVQDGSLLKGKQPGDLVKATLLVGEVDAHLSTLDKTGHTALATPPPADDTAKVLRPGDVVGDAALVDQDGKAKTLASLRGHRVAVTFVYTRCPLPDYCPLMNRHFAAVQKELASRPRLADVRLVTVTMDPEYDTPKVLKPLASTLDADPARWSFVTGQPDEVTKFGQQFGIYVERDPQNAAQLIHNLRTAVIGADGRLIKIESGNSWTPADLVADLEASSPAAH